MAMRLNDDLETDGEMHEINVTPFIDVMLVLLIIFMVAAPLYGRRTRQSARLNQRRSRVRKSRFTCRLKRISSFTSVTIRSRRSRWLTC